jgi:hypothetical protein
MEREIGGGKEGGREREREGKRKGREGKGKMQRRICPPHKLPRARAQLTHFRTPLTPNGARHIVGCQ